MSESLETLRLSAKMRKSLLRNVAVALLGAIPAFLHTTAAAAGGSSLFDKFVKVVHAPLRRDPENQQAKPEISCADAARRSITR